ncbi:hypothetical protein Tco_0180921 [Tanacetum coccineum]
MRTKHNIHPRTGSPLHYSHDENVLNTLRFMGKDGREIFRMPIPDTLLNDEIKGAPYYKDYQEHIKGWFSGKRRKAKSPLRLIDEPSDEGVPVEEPAHNNEEADIQRALELKVQGKGKEKRRPSMPTESFAHAESPSIDVELNLTDSETEFDEEASKINARNQEEGQAGPNPGVQDEDQAGPNPGTSDVSTQQKPEQKDEEFSTTAYPNVQGNIKLLTEDQVILEEPDSSTGTLSSLQNLDKDLSFTD